MQEVSPLAFEGVQSYLRELSLASNLLEDVPTHALYFLVGLTHLDLSFNKITVIATDNFVNMSSLQYLYLSNNLLHTIEDCAFSGITSTLKVLKLNDNLFMKVVPQFPIFKQAITIWLHECSIENLTQPFIRGNQSVVVRDLRLDRNNIRVIHPIAFKNLRISTLYLENNYIEDICSGALDGLNNFTRIQLRYNHISVISKGCFSTLSSLQQLFLDSNTISEVHGFNGLTSLTHLTLSYNQLNSIHNFTFMGIRKLKILSMIYNQIHFISTFAFHSLPNLRFLYLQGNMLTTLATDMFPVEFLSSGLLSIQRNPLICDCDIAGFEAVAVRIIAKSVCFNLASNKSYHLKAYTRQACLNDSVELETQTLTSNISATEETIYSSPIANNFITTLLIVFSSIIGTLFIMLGIRQVRLRLTNGQGENQDNFPMEDLSKHD